jgi:hypothetical protein
MRYMTISHFLYVVPRKERPGSESHFFKFGVLRDHGINTTVRENYHSQICSVTASLNR